MKIKNVKFGKKMHKYDGAKVPTPKTITVEMSLPEAVFISKTTGKMNWHAMEEVYPGGYEAGSEIYDCLNGDFFNRHFYDGDNDAVKVVQKKA